MGDYRLGRNGSYSTSGGRERKSRRKEGEVVSNTKGWADVKKSRPDGKVVDFGDLGQGRALR